MIRKIQGRKKKKEREMSKHSRRCSCGKEMKCRGASDCAGGISWKCKKCGKTVWERRTLTSPPIPLTYNGR